MDKRSWKPLGNLKQRGLINLQTRRNNDIWKKEYKVVSLTSLGQKFLMIQRRIKINKQQVFIAKYEPFEILGISYQETPLRLHLKLSWREPRFIL